MRQKIVYSEAFKLSVLHALETGKVSSFNEARHIYGVGGVGTIKRWAETYGKNHLIGKVIRVETVKETSEIKVLRKRVKDLEKALPTKTIDCIVSDAFIKIACRAANITDVEEFKKNTLGNCKSVCRAC